MGVAAHRGKLWRKVGKMWQGLCRRQAGVAEW